jgi:DNA-binding LacI/PurR family transcriptional regulator
VQPAYEIGLEAVKILLDDIEKPKKRVGFENKILKTEINVK